MSRLLALTLVATLLALPAHAQLAVIDPANLAQAILVADRTLQEYNTLLRQYEAILRMSQGLATASWHLHGRSAPWSWW